MTKSEKIKYIKNLPDEVVKQIAEMYEDTSIPVREIISKFNLPFSAGGLSGVLPPAIEEQTCKYCEVNLTRERNRIYPQDFVCPVCGHEEPNPRKESYGYRRFNCRCWNCRENETAKKELLMAERKKNIMLFIEESVGPVPYSEVTYFQKALVGSMIEWSSGESINRIISEKNRKKLSPVKTIDEFIIRELLSKSIIKIDEIDICSDIDAFSPDGKSIVNPEDLNYVVNIDCQADELLDMVMGKIEGTIDDEVALWQRMVAYEGLGYLKYIMDSSGWVFRPGDKTLSLFAEMATNYSLGQIIYLIYLSHQKVATYVLKRPTTRNHIYNIMVNKIEYYYRRASVEKWDVSHYKRPNNLETSAITKYVYTKVLKISDFGISIRASKQNLCMLRDANKGAVDDEGTVVDEGEIE